MPYHRGIANMSPSVPSAGQSLAVPVFTTWQWSQAPTHIGKAGSQGLCPEPRRGNVPSLLPTTDSPRPAQSSGCGRAVPWTMWAMSRRQSWASGLWPLASEMGGLGGCKRSQG